MLAFLSYILLALAAVVVLAVAGFFLFGPERSWRAIAGDPDLGPVELGAITRTRNPNDALMCTPGLCDGVKIDAAAPAFAETPDVLIGRIEDAMKANERYVQRVDDGSDPARARFVTWTPGLRFPDTNNFIAVPLESGRTGLVAYARAQLGRSDLGNNLKRLKRVTNGL